MEHIDIVIEVFERAKEIKRGEAKVIECPVCKGQLHIQRSSYNGHIFAKCENEKCITIMQ